MQKLWNQGKNDGPYAIKTKLGWCIVGPVNGTSRKAICCNQIGVRQADTNEVGKQVKTMVKETDVKGMQRLSYLQKRFSKNRNFEKNCARFMEEIISMG